MSAKATYSCLSHILISPICFNYLIPRLPVWLADKTFHLFWSRHVSGLGAFLVVSLPFASRFGLDYSYALRIHFFAVASHWHGVNGLSVGIVLPIVILK